MVKLAKKIFVKGNALNALLIFIPICIGLEMTHSSPVAIFITSALAVIPLAGLMGRSTEVIAVYAGPGIGGILNASLGNAAELIIGLVALKEGLIDVVKASLTGSIIGNILFVFGLAALAGGIKHKKQEFNATAAISGSVMLLLAVIGLVIPDAFHAFVDPGGERTMGLSIAISVILIVTYFLSLLFSLKTHKHLYNSGVTHEEPEWSFKTALIVIIGSTTAIAIVAEFLVGAVEATVAAVGFSEVFVGVVIIAIVGNAAEHFTAVLMAMKNKMDLSINISIESSKQIALFVAPVLVFASLFTSTPMTLEFTHLEVLAVLASVVTLAFISLDGASNWLEGVQLLAVYAILAVTFYFVP